MASPRFDSCQVAFSKKIGDTVASASSAGTILSAAERDAYINLAANEMFRKYWELVRGNTEHFIELFPELQKTGSLTADGSGVGALATTGLYDFFKIIDGYKGATEYIRALDKTLYNTVKTGVNSLFVPSATKYYMIELNRSLYFFPATEFYTETVAFTYIARPVDPANGNPFTNGGTNDLPFYSIWNEEIAETAYQIWRANQQEGR